MGFIEPYKDANSLRTNRIKKVTVKIGISTRLVSLMADVDYTTASSWNSNESQPSSESLNRISELVEMGSQDLFERQGRLYTGMAIALEVELKRLVKSGIPYEMDGVDKVTGQKIKVNNTGLIKELKEYEKKYQKKLTKNLKAFRAKTEPNILVVSGGRRKRSRVAEIVFKNVQSINIRWAELKVKSERKLNEEE